MDDVGAKFNKVQSLENRLNDRFLAPEAVCYISVLHSTVDFHFLPPLS